jgi:hypothetical protein
MQSTGYAKDIAEESEKDDGNGNQKEKKKYKLKDIYNTSSRLVLEAASILEDEIASGIIAAKKAESRLINVKHIRSTDQENLILRFRKDAHEILDIVVDLVTVATQYLDKLAKLDIVWGEGRERKKQSSTSDGIPTIHISEEIAAGKSAKIFMSLENSGTSKTEEFRLYCTDLVNAAGKRIAYRAINFSPSVVTIAPLESSKVEIEIKVPKSAPPGKYSGLIQAQNMDALRAILLVNVI